MKRLQRITEHFVQGIFTLSGSITGLVILLIVIFLFKEGFGLFRNPEIEKGYALCLHVSNPVEKLHSQQIKLIFDSEITNWQELGGKDEEIRLFRFDEIFSLYSDDELGENYALLSQKLGEVVEQNPAIIAFLPEKYLPANNLYVKILPAASISPVDFFSGREWMPTSTPAPQFGTLPLILGTLWVSIFAILIALPLGLGVAIYISELASERIRKLLKPTIELLAGIP